MKFYLVDRIESLRPGQSIETVKALSLAEEYLADHFPAFPVLPGVMMLEAMTQSAAWLVRIEQDWSRSIVVLSTARNVRYASFVRPGNVLRCRVEAKEIGEEISKFKCDGFVDETHAVSAKIELRSFNLADRPGAPAADKQIIEQLKQRFKLIGGPEAMSGAGQS